MKHVLICVVFPRWRGLDDVVGLENDVVPQQVMTVFEPDVDVKTVVDDDVVFANAVKALLEV